MNRKVPLPRFRLHPAGFSNIMIHGIQIDMGNTPDKMGRPNPEKGDYPHGQAYHRKKSQNEGSLV